MAAPVHNIREMDIEEDVLEDEKQDDELLSEESEIEEFPSDDSSTSEGSSSEEDEPPEEEWGAMTKHHKFLFILEPSISTAKFIREESTLYEPVLVVISVLVDSFM
ncbi:uncharacterized protein LOC113230624 isoform X2 [Hyposmocoma kahamanoa]|uniref:uncharacterized protein LOC113230624 isoform X2 n=1 Tax=Hyposmocoma kahamanoa TaxID=1477025 RepID=UPI000E6DA15F|nr:uncharacterized protein LOC113230624 isoform X2 [Hyposmocoma kahamanoa]